MSGYFFLVRCGLEDRLKGGRPGGGPEVDASCRSGSRRSAHQASELGRFSVDEKRLASILDGVLVEHHLARRASAARTMVSISDCSCVSAVPRRRSSWTALLVYREPAKFQRLMRNRPDSPIGQDASPSRPPPGRPPFNRSLEPTSARERE